MLSKILYIFFCSFPRMCSCSHSILFCRQAKAI
ncbi:hypothetical protein CP8484711_1435, partial [Chlamydia psittaci 84-8471/1]